MAMGERTRDRQPTMWVPTTELRPQPVIRSTRVSISCCVTAALMTLLRRGARRSTRPPWADLDWRRGSSLAEARLLQIREIGTRTTGC